jgi:hypothetical protein
MNKDLKVEETLRTESETLEASRNRECFERNPVSWEKKMENFPKYVRRQNLTRFLALYEIFKKVIEVKGSIIECGVFQGFGISSWSKFSAILEPVNLTRRIYGFDSFKGFPSVSKKDNPNVKKGALFANCYDEILELANIHDSTRFLGHIPKVNLIRGDATESIPRFVKENPHLIISLLFLDFDLYEPTKIALEYFVPRMPKGAIIAFDELDNPLWPGETEAMIEVFRENRLEIKRLPFDPFIGFASID